VVTDARPIPPVSCPFPQIADDVAVLIGELGLDRPVVGGYSDGGQVALELGVRHPGVAGALIVGGAYPDWAGSGLREVWRESTSRV
jgi:pimeloyl-ACP methyl ester carboxylesterase